MIWLVAHLVAVAVLTGVGWVVQLVVYPAFRLVDGASWARYHGAHTQAITRVVALPWFAQGGSTVALLVLPATRPAGVALGVLALATVVATVVAAVPAHGRLAAGPQPADVTLLLRANLVRTVAWTGSTALAAALLI